MSIFSDFFKSIAKFYKALKYEFFTLQAPSFNTTTLYVIGVIFMTLVFCIFFSIIDSLYGYFFTSLFKFFV